MKSIIIVTAIALIKLSAGEQNCTTDFNVTPEEKAVFQLKWQSRGEIQNHISDIESSPNHVNLKCYINCVYENIGLMTNGEINVVAKNKIQKEADKCETAFNLYKFRQLSLPRLGQQKEVIEKCIQDAELPKSDIEHWIRTLEVSTKIKCVFKCMLTSTGIMKDGVLVEDANIFDYKKHDDDCETAYEIIGGFAKLNHKVKQIV